MSEGVTVILKLGFN